jgi:hypothetical protein
MSLLVLDDVRQPENRTHMTEHLGAGARGRSLGRALFPRMNGRMLTSNELTSHIDI